MRRLILRGGAVQELHHTFSISKIAWRYLE
jgi:hypothetical protein